MNKFNIKVGDWCYVFGDDVFVQISKIEYDSNNNIKNVYATDGFVMKIKILKKSFKNFLMKNLKNAILTLNINLC